MHFTVLPPLTTRLPSGEKATRVYGADAWLPEETVEAVREYVVSIKGPLTTPTSGGIRSLNVALRQLLDLYVCLRPVRWFKGVPAPVKHPEKVDMVIFRENTEDIYTGIEFEYGTPENQRFKQLLKEVFPQEYAKIRFPETAGIGLKPISKEGTFRLVRAAIRYALENGRRSVTLVHKGNIMKYTEGAFRNWGYELAESEFGDQHREQADHGERQPRRGAQPTRPRPRQRVERGDQGVLVGRRGHRAQCTRCGGERMRSPRASCILARASARPGASAPGSEGNGFRYSKNSIAI